MKVETLEYVGTDEQGLCTGYTRTLYRDLDTGVGVLVEDCLTDRGLDGIAYRPSMTKLTAALTASAVAAWDNHEDEDGRPCGAWEAWHWDNAEEIAYAPCNPVGPYYGDPIKVLNAWAVDSRPLPVRL